MIIQLSDATAFGVNSYEQYVRLKNSDEKTIQFDNAVEAFHCVQAKRMGLGFRNTTFSIDVKNVTDDNPLNRLKLDYMRLYSLKYVDCLLKSRTVIAPHVSVCIPYYNAELWFTEALNSLLGNDYVNKEIIVIDNGSNVPLALDIPGIKIVRTQNNGQSAARNLAARHAKGSYLLFCDADNIFRRDMISKMVSAIQISGCDCVSPYLERFGETIDVWTPLGACAEYGFFANSFGDSNMLIRADVFHTLGGFNEQMRGFEDWDFLARLVLAGYNYDVIPEPLVKYRVRTDGVNATADLSDAQWHIAGVVQAIFSRTFGVCGKVAKRVLRRN